MLLPCNLQGISSWSKKLQLYLKIIFCEYVKFGQTSLKIDILPVTTLSKFESKILLHTCNSYDFDYLPHSKLRFYQIDFQLNTDLPSQFCVFNAKSPSVTHRSISKENAFKKSKHPSHFLRKIKGSSSFFLLLKTISDL